MCKKQEVHPFFGGELPVFAHFNKPITFMEFSGDYAEINQYASAHIPSRK